MKRSILRPYKILAFLVFQETDALVYTFDKYVVMNTGKAAKELKMSSHDLRRDLKWLREKGYFVELIIVKGQAKFRLYISKRYTKADHYSSLQNDQS